MRARGTQDSQETWVLQKGLARPPRDGGCLCRAGPRQPNHSTIVRMAFPANMLWSLISVYSIIFCLSLSQLGVEESLLASKIR